MIPASLASAEITAALATLPGWEHDQNALLKVYHFGSFRRAIDFMTRASFLAESMDHHPLWTNMYDTVTIRLSTHDAGNRVTARDLELARRLENLSTKRFD